jgi:hypothetical protein
VEDRGIALPAPTWRKKWLCLTCRNTGAMLVEEWDAERRRYVLHEYPCPCMERYAGPAPDNSITGKEEQRR